MKNLIGFMRPEGVLDNIDIKRGMKIAEFGCGAGYFTIPLAKKVGREGEVYAIDVRESALDAVRSRAKILSILNIKIIRANLEKDSGSGLKDRSTDIVFLANILFQSKLKGAILKETARILKKSGKIVVIEWNSDASFGPEADYRISKNELKDLLKRAGFVLEKEFNAGSSHYGLVLSL
ncbi:MAG: methyltransferase domain-containing protein [Candidatus Spechtbacterales bacterium]